MMEIKMRTIKDLKKNDIFKFYDRFYIVKLEFSDWKTYNMPYLKTECGQMFFNEELNVEVIK